MKVLIVSGGGWHEFDWTTEQLTKILEERRSAECRVVAGPEGLGDDNLAWADMVIVNYQGGELSEDRAAALEKFIEQGGGLVGIHSAADSFRNSERYLRLLGCEFQTHGPPAPVRIHLNEPGHQITAGVNDQFVIDDEIYQCKVHGQPTILASVNWGGTSFPMITTNTHGRGRIYYLALGHYRCAWGQWEFQTLLVRGIDWVLGGEIDKPIGAGLIGVGPAYGMGKYHGELISKTFGLELRAACDINPERLTAIKEQFSQIKTYEKVDEMLARDDVGLVTVITPHNIHAELARRGLQAGKHVVVEKPFTVTSAEATELIELAEKQKLMVTCFQNRRWDGELMALREVVSSGRIGRLFQVRVQTGGYSMPPEAWRSFKEISGGLLYDWGAHHFDWILQLADQPIKAVFAAVHKPRWHWCTGDDHAKVIVTFEDGTVGEYETSTVSAISDPYYVTVWASEGGAVIERVGDKRQVRVLRAGADGAQAEEIMPVPAAQWSRFYLNIADHLHFGEPLVVRPEDSRRVIALIEAAYESARTGQAVRPKFP